MNKKESGSNVLSDAVSKVNDAVVAAKLAANDKAQERLDAKVCAYEPAVKKAIKSLEGTWASRVLQCLGDSPLPLTEDLAVKAKKAFPLPKEQTVIWADAEFDLRPSGIVATDKGIFVKTDAKVVSFGKKPKQDSDGAVEAKEANRSALSYFMWEYFEPSWFTSDDRDENVALAVSPECSHHFIAVCREMESTQKALQVRHTEKLIESLEGDAADIKASAISAADVVIGEEAVFPEQKSLMNNPAGHGEMAEEAITKLDKLHGLDAKVVGRDNAKDGADRIVDGVLVQTKYYKSARGSLEACFDPNTGLYRYMSESGEPMQLEVPKDQYEKVLELFKWKIEQGKVPGVTDPAEAENIVRRGRLTYQQAMNLTKPGTIESLTYDAATGAVICACAFGISFLAASFVSYRKCKDMSEAIQAGIAAGVQVFGISFVQHMVVSQLSRTGLSGMLMAPSKYVVEKLGYRASAVIVNGIRALMGKSAISGAAAAKQLAKILRSNAVTAAVTFAVFSVPETYRLASKKSSGAQYATNIASLAASIAGGAGGVVAAGTAAAKVAGAVGTTVAPGVGTAIGIAGGFAGGAAAAAATNAVGGILYEGDGATFSRILNALVSTMSVEYMLDDREIDLLVEKLDAVSQKDFKKLMDDTFSADKQEKVLRDFLAPVFDEVVSTRERFELPSDEVINEALLSLTNIGVGDSEA